ncbi:MAG: L,D-transpeptidase [Sulfuricurvum sp.]|uniref:L,D-transpeptidase n=1 Tax=Sulfuricurvum sp. TaxID=2025608 RepID=UPI0025E62A14|nr:L,D-transpeptidase [Sulfuricurvum sp.]MBV5320764.1 L,D-transpeptidase [Sulfuricurvum sp.]
MIKKVSFFFILIKVILISAIADTNVYTVFICSDKTYDQAFVDKNRYIKKAEKDIFIIRSEAGAYRIAYGTFESVSDAEAFKEKLSDEIKKMKPYVEKLTAEYLAQTENKKVVKFPLQSDESVSNEKHIDTFENNTSVLSEQMMQMLTVDMNIYDPRNLDRIVIYINSTKNFMTVNGYKNKQKFKLNKYKVSTAKPDVKKPEGEGGISSISLHPIWYPTAETLDYFKKVRNIELPKAIPPESPYNYMGSAKISLTHTVDGRQTYRIHGTINEKTIGKHESAGCIRMKNSEVLALAKYLKEFASIRGIKQILVVMD